MNLDTAKILDAPVVPDGHLVIRQLVNCTNDISKHDLIHAIAREVANQMAVPETRPLMVWRPDGGPPSLEHQTMQAAEDEARRIASRHPRSKVLIIRVLRKFEGQVQVVELDPSIASAPDADKPRP